MENRFDFRAALDAIEAGSRVRREAWHNGRRWIASQEKDGFAEYVMALAPEDQPIEWPLAMGRADWFATDWIIVDGPVAGNYPIVTSTEERPVGEECGN